MKNIKICMIAVMAMLLTVVTGFTSQAAQDPLRIRINPTKPVEVGQEATFEVSIENISKETYKAGSFDIFVSDDSETVAIEKGWNVIDNEAVSKAYTEKADAGALRARTNKDLAPGEKITFEVQGRAETGFDESNHIYVSAQISEEENWEHLGSGSYPLGEWDSIFDGVFSESELTVKRGDTVKVGVEVTNTTEEDVVAYTGVYWYASTMTGDWAEAIEPSVDWEKELIDEEKLSIAAGETVKGTLTVKIPENTIPSQIDVGVDLFTVSESGEDHKTYFSEDVTLNLEGGVLNPYKDVVVKDGDKEGDWYADAALFMLDQGIMTGMKPDEFGADVKLSRAQYVTILYRLYGQVPVEFDPNAFPDITEEMFNDPGVFYAEAAIWAKKEGVVTGYADGCFGAGDEITREQMATMLYRYAGYVHIDTQTKADLSKLPGADEVSDFAQDGMAWAVGNELIKGEGETGYLNAQGTAERCHCATIMMRFMQKFYVL